MRYLVDYAQVELKTRRVDARSAKEAKWTIIERLRPDDRSAMLIVGVRASKRRRQKGA